MTDFIYLYYFFSLYLQPFSQKGLHSVGQVFEVGREEQLLHVVDQAHLHKVTEKVKLLKIALKLNIGTGLELDLISI